jgi:hypothetical protein
MAPRGAGDGGGDTMIVVAVLTDPSGEGCTSVCVELQKFSAIQHSCTVQVAPSLKAPGFNP